MSTCASLSSLDGTPAFLFAKQHEGQSAPGLPAAIRFVRGLQLVMRSRSQARRPGWTLSTSGSLWLYHGCPRATEPEQLQHG